MARFLVDLGPDEMLDPRAALAALPDVLQGRRPSWGNGLVDRWDGVAWVHTAALVAARLDDTIAARLWRGQVRALFPFLDQMRTAFAAKYEQRLLAHLPIIKDFHGRKKPYADPYELEHYDIKRASEIGFAEAGSDAPVGLHCSAPWNGAHGPR